MDSPQTSMLQRLLAVAQAAKPGDPTSEYDPTKLVSPEAPKPVTAVPMPEITPPQANDVVPPQAIPAAAEPQTPDAPKLAPQGPKNGFLKILSQIAGQSGDQPKPGEEYKGPTTTSEKIGGAMRLAGRIGNGLAAAGGTPGQQELAEKRSEFGPELQSTTELKKAQIESNDLYHRGQVAVGHEKNDVSEENAAAKTQVAQQRAAAYARIHGQVLDPNVPTGVRSMTEDEILSDPILSQNRDLAKSAMMTKQAEAAYKQAQTDAIMNKDNPQFALKAEQIRATLEMARANLGARMHALANSDQRIEMMGLRDELSTGMNTANGTFLADDPEHTPPNMLADQSGQAVPTKYNTIFAPTGATRTKGEQAKTIIESGEQLVNHIDALRDQIGPLASRYNNLLDFVGNPPPEYKGLAAELSSWIALHPAAHGFRGQNAVKEFQKAFGPIAMDPDALIAGIRGSYNTMHALEDTGKPKTVGKPKTAPNSSAPKGTAADPMSLR